jgi:uncharacterized protein (TIGR03086 family)
VADRVPLDFDPPVRKLRELLLGIDDDELPLPTPCAEWNVAALLDHVMDLSFAFTQAARKRKAAPGTDTSPPVPSAQHLSRHWRSSLPVLLEDLATAWRDPAAWTGTTQAGGAVMPAAAIGGFAMNELITHGWDLAKATGQEYAADPRTLEALIEFLSQVPSDGRVELFGPVVPVDSEATVLDQLIARTGRRPDWPRPRRHYRPAA